VVLAEAAQDLRQVTGTELAGSAGAVRELGESWGLGLHESFISRPPIRAAVAWDRAG
jgi:hypothetical protein